MYLRRAGFVIAALAMGALTCPAASDGALAELTGGSGYSARLSSNRSIRRQQLICDPVPGSGSATVLYDPAVVTLVSIFNEPNFSITASSTFVGISNIQPNTVSTVPGYFNNAGDLTESGRVQVSWTPAPGIGSGESTLGSLPSDPSGFTTVSSFGTNDGGVNTFGLEFQYVAPSDSTLSPYTIEGDVGGLKIFNPDTSAFTGANNPPDSLVDANGDVIPYNQISPASVDGSLVPEPAGLALMAMGSAGLLARRCSRRS